MMGDTTTGPLPVSVHEYVADDNHDATPDEILSECDLDESRREQVEHFLAITRYSMFENRAANDADGLRTRPSSGPTSPTGTYSRVSIYSVSWVDRPNTHHAVRFQTGASHSSSRRWMRFLTVLGDSNDGQACEG